ncbi:hypothetical protein HYQ59_1747 [Lactobacillus crispatus]|nr:hypothetical protein [Lactobacillus crispatus]
MATTRKELKEQARDQLRGNWGWQFCCHLLAG